MTENDQAKETWGANPWKKYSLGQRLLHLLEDIVLVKHVEFACI